MVTKDLVKVEIDKIQDKYLEVLYKIIKALESPSEAEGFNQTTSLTKYDVEIDWPDFIKETYGCLADDPIERGKQGKYEIRETINWAK